eukprot:1147401-Pelagomonas_calceolata.AAC.5
MEVAEEEKGTQEVGMHSETKGKEKLQMHVLLYNPTINVSDAQEVVLPDGVSYKDLRRGGGSTPIKGYLAVIHFTTTPVIENCLTPMLSQRSPKGNASHHTSETFKAC